MSATDYFEGLFRNTAVNAILQMDLDGHINRINPAFTKLFGYGQDELWGKNFSLLFTEQDRLLQKPIKELQKVARLGQADDKNYFVHKSGYISWVSGESILISIEGQEKTILKIIQDIHDEKEFELSLERAGTLRQHIVEMINDVVIVLDLKMNIITANASFYRFFKIIEKDNADFGAVLLPFDPGGKLRDLIKEAMTKSTGFNNVQVELLVPGGERVLETSCSRMEGADQDFYLLVGHDITVQKRSEVEREDIMGFVAHELRNPLANILLTNDLMSAMLEKNPQPDFIELLHKSKNNIIRLNKMISELYDAEKINTGKLIPEFAEFDFDTMIKEAIDTVQLLHPAYQIRSSGTAGITFNGDRYRLIQVVTNYLQNSIKYSGGQTDITLAVAVKNSFVVVSVEDRGLGIPPAQIPYIFDRFFRAEKTRNLEGIGLGLYLCRRIIDAHKGKVWAESEEGKGSVFYFSLPIPQIDK